MRDEVKDYTNIEMDFFRIPTETDQYLFINVAQITRVAVNRDSASIYLADGGPPVVFKGDILDKFVPWVESRNVLTLIPKEE